MEFEVLMIAFLGMLPKRMYCDPNLTSYIVLFSQYLGLPKSEAFSKSSKS